MNNKELKYLTKPISILLALIILVIAIVYTGYTQLNLIYAKVTDLKATEAKLSTKLGILESVGPSLAGNVSFIDVALPSRSSIIYGLAQVKKIARENGIIISNLKAGSAILENNGISKYSINFEAEGLDSDMQKFLLSFYEVLPIMNIDKVKIDKSGDIVRSTVSLYIYFANLPEKIPAISEPVNELSSEDIKKIKELSTYTLPDFFDPKPGDNQTEVRNNPFN